MHIQRRLKKREKKKKKQHALEETKRKQEQRKRKKAYPQLQQSMAKPPLRSCQPMKKLTEGALQWKQSLVSAEDEEAILSLSLSLDDNPTDQKSFGFFVVFGFEMIWHCKEWGNKSTQKRTVSFRIGNFCQVLSATLTPRLIRSALAIVYLFLSFSRSLWGFWDRLIWSNGREFFKILVFYSNNMRQKSL